MSTPVQLPALGESVTEGTISRWLKSVGDHVEVDEPESDGQELTDQSGATVSADADEPEENIAFDRMSEEELLAGIEGLVPPEKSDDF